MFFYASKLIWSFLVPTNLLLFLGAGGLVMSLTQWKRWGVKLMAISLTCLLIIAFTPASDFLMRPLENRFSPPQTLDHIDGIIILGGAVGILRDQIKLSPQGARMSGTLALWQQHPNAKLVFTGGVGGLLTDGDRWTEAQAAKRFFQEVGADHNRVIYEDRSRNTRENALYTMEKIQPKAGERWVLVTSAFHMARSVGCFRAVGWNVIPYPVDYETEEEGIALNVSRDASGNLKRFDIAAKEWIGLIAYRFQGYTSALFPAPSSTYRPI